MKINNLYTDKQMRMPRDYQAIKNDEMEYINCLLYTSIWQKDKTTR